MKCKYFLLLVQPNYAYFLYQWNPCLHQEVLWRETEIIFEKYITHNCSPLIYKNWYHACSKCKREMNTLLVIFTPSSKEKSHGPPFSLSFLQPTPDKSRYKLWPIYNFSLVKSIYPSWTSTMLLFIFLFYFQVCNMHWSVSLFT